MTASDLDIPPAWSKAADLVLGSGWRRILVIGATDVGKSAYCRYLSGRLLDAGARVAIVDGDIGQKDIGPPAAVTLGFPERSQTFSATPPVGFHFIGSTNPAPRITSLVVGVARLSEAAAGEAVTLINASGLVHGPGRRLQARQIEAVRPDMIIALERDRELAALLDAHSHYRILRLPRSPKAKRKSAAKRAAARRRRFAAYFQAASCHRLPLDDLVIQRSLLSDESAEITPNLLCGIADRAGAGTGLAIIEAIDGRDDTISLITPVPRDRINLLQLGDMRIDRDGRELTTEPSS
ncbi:Clp1/GlmU family protein [Rhodospirillaceae bacterium SYSU D60014]|uniref:Clp1/GlmU family protein n=1 Tax=Virgifigura deserti TaxID=2268457 RepID=UPI000E67047A